MDGGGGGKLERVLGLNAGGCWGKGWGGGTRVNSAETSAGTELTLGLLACAHMSLAFLHMKRCLVYCSCTSMSVL